MWRILGAAWDNFGGNYLKNMKQKFDGKVGPRSLQGSMDSADLLFTTLRQADIIFFSASDRDFPENFGLKVRISIFCD